MKPTIALTLALIVPLGACMAEPDVTDTCGADGFQSLIGQSGSVAEALQLDRPKRVVSPDSAVTMDYVQERINFALDTEGRIVRVSCG